MTKTSIVQRRYMRILRDKNMRIKLLHERKTERCMGGMLCYEFFGKYSQRVRILYTAAC